MQSGRAIFLFGIYAGKPGKMKLTHISIVLPSRYASGYDLIVNELREKIKIKIVLLLCTGQILDHTEKNVQNAYIAV